MNNLNIDHSSLIDRASVWLRCLVIAGALACLVFSPGARAVTPPPDGGYPNENTAEGDGALFNLTIGRSNTATGLDALFSNINGGVNTATGDSALSSNTSGGD